MYHKTLYKSIKVSTESHKSIGLSYYIISSECKDQDSEHSLYGVEITKSKDDAVVESAIAESVFSSKEDIMKLTEVLCRGEVTPITLHDILYDYML